MSVNEPEATRTALATVADSLIGQDGGRGLAPHEHARLRATAVLQNALILTDPHQEDNPIVYHNPAFETLTGYSALEIVGRNCRFLQGPDTDPNAVDELRAAIRDERKTQITIKNYRKDGIAFWNELTIAPVRNDDGALTHFVGVQTDVTAIREAEEALRISEERFRSLVAGVKDYAIFMLDPEGRVMTWNAGGEVIKGYMAEEVLGKHFRMLYPESDAAAGKPEAQLRTALEEGRAEDRVGVSGKTVRCFGRTWS